MTNKKNKYVTKPKKSNCDKPYFQNSPSYNKSVKTCYLDP